MWLFNFCQTLQLFYSPSHQHERAYPHGTAIIRPRRSRNRLCQSLETCTAINRPRPVANVLSSEATFVLVAADHLDSRTLYPTCDPWAYYLRTEHRHMSDATKSSLDRKLLMSVIAGGSSLPSVRQDDGPCWIKYLASCFVSNVLC